MQNENRSNVEKATSSQCMIDIQGMKYQSCVRKITDTLKENEAVVSVQINLELKEGVVIYEADKISTSQIVDIVNSLGFVSTLKLSTIESLKGKVFLILSSVRKTGLNCKLSHKQNVRGM